MNPGLRTTADKLSLKSGIPVYVNIVPSEYARLIGVPGENISFARKPRPRSITMIHLFFKTRKEFQTGLMEGKQYLQKDGMIWISWPKKSSAEYIDLDENHIREFALELGLVDIKVCSISPVWSGLKLVYRKKNRS